MLENTKGGRPNPLGGVYSEAQTIEATLYLVKAPEITKDMITSGEYPYHHHMGFAHEVLTLAFPKNQPVSRIQAEICERLETYNGKLWDWETVTVFCGGMRIIDLTRDRFRNLHRLEPGDIVTISDHPLTESGFRHYLGKELVVLEPWPYFKVIEPESGIVIYPHEHEYVVVRKNTRYIR